MDGGWAVDGRTRQFSGMFCIFCSRIFVVQHFSIDSKGVGNFSWVLLGFLQVCQKGFVSFGLT